MKKKSGIKCDLCNGEYTFCHRNKYHIRNSIICINCFTLKNLNFQKNKQSPISDLYIKYLNEYVKEHLKKTGRKEVLVFDEDLPQDCFDFGDDVSVYMIRDFEKIKDINDLLKYAGTLKEILVPHLNVLNFNVFYEKIKNILNSKFNITLGFFREQFYIGKKDFDYDYVYNPLTIEINLRETKDYVQENYFYKDNYLIIQIARKEPHLFQIEDLEKLSNKFVDEDTNIQHIVNP